MSFWSAAALQTYSYRSASIGSSVAAFMAGYTPETSPISTETEKARTSEPLLMMVDQPAKLAIRRDIDAPSSVNAALQPPGLPALDSGFDTDLAPSNFGPLDGR